MYLTRSGDAVQVVDAGPAVRDLTPVRSYWSKNFQREQWPVGDLFYGLAERFVGDVVLADPAAFARLQGRSCLYLANHQVGIESLLFSLIISGLSKTTTVTLAKTEHRQSWLGTLIAHCEWLQGRSMLIMRMEKYCHWSMHLDASMTELTCSWKPVPSTVLPFLP